MYARHAGLAVLVVASIAFAPSAHGQVSPSGNRVRVMESTSKRALVIGQLVRRTNDSVVVVPDSLSSQGTEQVFVLGPQHRLQQSVGFRRRTLRGMGTGLLVGAVGGGLSAAAGYKKEKDCEVYCSNGTRRGDAFLGAFVLAWPGLLIGGIVGASNTHEVWRPMAEHGVRMAIAPTAKGGAQFAARVSF